MIRKISDDLGALLGMIYKWQKDVVETKIMDFIGYEIEITTTEILVRAKEKCRTKLYKLLE